MRLILFDIDGTLIDSGGAGVRSLDLAFRKVFSVLNAFQGISMAGKTDTQIIKEGLIKHGLSMDDFDAIIEAYLLHLRQEIRNDGKHTKPGIYEILKQLNPMEDIGLGLLTGNLEQGARIKLEPFDLNKYFPSGAFGSDDEDRNKLLPFAVNRFEKIFNKRIDIEKSIVIGDTPRDVECAHIYGAVCIGVATGPYSIDELTEAKADYVVKDLSDHMGLLRSLNFLFS
ncbi:MAG: HAD family hydrolase [Thermodesulfovibrionales bacterium]|jgi:phosphoglycolate phosphatase-like HAD superfamily hydrolase